MRARGFSLLEIVVVVSAITISGAMAVFAMSDQIVAARARSDEMGMFLKFKAERNTARERLRGLALRTDNGGKKMVFLTPTIVRVSSTTICTVAPGAEVVATADFGDAAGEATSSQLCLDENGRPIGPFSFRIKGSDGRINDVSVSESGQLISNLGERTGQRDKEEATGGGRQPPIPQDFNVAEPE